MIQNWELLTALYDEKSITKAAAKLFLSQPAVTKRLKTIEIEFGVEIVNRTPKGVIFTEAGIRLVQYAKEMLESYENIKKELASLSNSREMTIKIGITNGFARKYLTKILSEFKEISPNVNFEIVTGWSSDIVTKIENGEVDTGFIRGEYHLSKKFVFLFNEYIYIVSSKKINLEDLPNISKIEFESDIQFNAMLDKWWKTHYSLPPKKRMKVDRSDICIKMVTQGLGYSILPESILNKEDSLIKMKICDENNEPIKRVTRLFYSENFGNLDLGQKFINFITKIDFTNSQK